VQVYAEPRIVLTIPASAFNPAPRVDSALVRLDVRDHPAVDVPDFDAFFRLVEAVFQYRRKQLGGALGRVGGTSSTEAGGRLRELGIDPKRRPQTLSLAEWEGLNRVFGR
jgi:16S rRNA (adenine1518-N6/adenine1519-N6)-dimethyltransferase